MKFVSTLGRALKIDAAMGDLHRTFVARVLIEIDVATPPIKRVCIGDEDYNFWQHLEFDNFPSYCSFCGKYGHEKPYCMRKDPFLCPLKMVQEAPSRIQKQRQVFIPKFQLDMGKEMVLETEIALVLLPTLKSISLTIHEFVIPINIWMDLPPKIL